MLSAGIPQIRVRGEQDQRQPPRLRSSNLVSILPCYLLKPMATASTYHFLALRQYTVEVASTQDHVGFRFHG